MELLFSSDWRSWIPEVTSGLTSLWNMIWLIVYRASQIIQFNVLKGTAIKWAVSTDMITLTSNINHYQTGGWRIDTNLQTHHETASTVMETSYKPWIILSSWQPQTLTQFKVQRKTGVRRRDGRSSRDNSVIQQRPNIYVTFTIPRGC